MRLSGHLQNVLGRAFAAVEQINARLTFGQLLQLHMHLGFVALLQNHYVQNGESDWSER